MLHPVAGKDLPPGLQKKQPASFDDGKDLFFHETFGGNGRTCATCHDPRGEFTVSPDLVQQRFLLDANDPLFRPIDSDAGDGASYTTVLTHALFRVTIPLNANVSVVGDPGRRSITVWRAVPTIDNVSLTAPYLADGRAATLQEQERGAIRDHLMPRRAPSPSDLDALAAFMVEQFYPSRLRSLTDTTDPLPKAPGFSLPVESPSALRGKASFEAHCVNCHGGELGNQPRFPELRFSDVFVSELNRSDLPMLRLAFRLPDGSVAETETPDPGRAAITGSLDDLNAFDIPALRGVKHTAPYFHDNSAATLRDVVDHYNRNFQFNILPDEEDDLISYLELF
jgi:cytochrome c peroxidase